MCSHGASTALNEPSHARMAFEYAVMQSSAAAAS
jgi:hypothetical protein